MKVGDIVQIHIPKSRESAKFYKFNNCVGEIKDLIRCGAEYGFAVVEGTDRDFWPFEWLTPFEPENDEYIEASEICELWRETE